MAVAFDAVGPSSTGAKTAGAASLTWAHTCTGSDRVLIVMATCNSQGSDITTCTYNGVAMTKVSTVFANGSVYGYVQMFRLIAPATGANNVVLTASSGSPVMTGTSLSFTGVHQTTPLGTAATANGYGTALTVDVTGTTAGNMVVAGCCAGEVLSAATQTTRSYVSQEVGNGYAGNSATSTAAASGTITSAFTASTGTGHASIAAELLASAGGPTNWSISGSLGFQVGVGGATLRQRFLPGAATLGTSASGGVTVSQPAGVIAGDLLLLFVAHDMAGAASTMTVGGASWTSLYDGTNGTAQRLTIYARIATGTDTCTITSSTANDYSSCILRVVGATSSIASISVGTAATGSDVNPDSPSISSLTSLDYLAISVAAMDLGGTSRTITSGPTGYTLAFSGSNSRSANNSSATILCLASKGVGTVTSEDPGTWVISNTGAWVAQTLMIPSATTGTTRNITGALGFQIGPSTTTVQRTKNITAPLGFQVGTGTTSIQKTKNITAALGFQAGTGTTTTTRNRYFTGALGFQAGVGGTTTKRTVYITGAQGFQIGIGANSLTRIRNLTGTLGFQVGVGTSTVVRVVRITSPMGFQIGVGSTTISLTKNITGALGFQSGISGGSGTLVRHATGALGFQVGIGTSTIQPNHNITGSPGFQVGVSGATMTRSRLGGASLGFQAGVGGGTLNRNQHTTAALGAQVGLLSADLYRLGVWAPQAFVIF